MVMKESPKWRSGRDAERIVDLRERSRGGKSPRSFSNEEGEAAERDGDVVVPASETAALEVIQSEFALEILVHALGTPALLDQLHELHEGHALVGGEVEVDGLVFIVAPFTNEPHPIAATRFTTIVCRRDDAQEGEPCGEWTCGPFAPRVTAEGTLFGEASGDLTRG